MPCPGGGRFAKASPLPYFFNSYLCSTLQICIVFRSPILAPHFFFSCAQEKKKRVAPGAKKKRTFDADSGRTVLLSRAAERKATAQQAWYKADTA